VIDKIRQDEPGINDPASLVALLEPIVLRLREQAYAAEDANLKVTRLYAWSSIRRDKRVGATGDDQWFKWESDPGPEKHHKWPFDVPDNVRGPRDDWGKWGPLENICIGRLTDPFLTEVDATRGFLRYLDALRQLERRLRGQTDPTDTRAQTGTERRRMPRKHRRGRVVTPISARRTSNAPATDSAVKTIATALEGMQTSDVPAVVPSTVPVPRGRPKRKRNQQSEATVLKTSERRLAEIRADLKANGVHNPNQWAKKAGLKNPGPAYGYWKGKSFPSQEYDLALARAIGRETLPK
jgi:hypothetical protein